MNQNYTIVHEKLVSNTTEKTWAQAFSTLHVFVVVSLKKQGESDIQPTTLGKEVLEKLQREYFAIDEKNLSTIKQAVENTVSIIPAEIEHSLVLVTIIEGVAYIIISSAGKVLLKRDETIGIIAEAEPQSITGFSGELRHNDMLFLQTPGFAQKIDPSLYQTFTKTINILDIAETLAPLISTEPQGTEAAIVLQIQSHDASYLADEETFEEVEKDEEQKQEKPEALKPSFITTLKERIPHPATLSSFIKNLHIPKKEVLLKKNVLIGIGIAVLLSILIGGIIHENMNKEKKQLQEEFAHILAPTQQQLDEAIALASLNKPLALETLYEAKKILLAEQDKFPQGTPEREQLDTLLEKVNAEIQKLGGGEQLGGEKLFFDPSQEKIKQVGHITIKGGSIIATGTNNTSAVLLSKSGEIEQFFEGESTRVVDISADEDYFYMLTNDSVIKQEKNEKENETIIEDLQAPKSISTFGNNIYVLDTRQNTIKKFIPEAYNDTDYFSQEPDFSKNPVSFSIDASVWVLLDDGSIQKYTRGSKDAFSIQGLPTSIGKGSSIYTDVDYANLYVLDPSGKRMVSIQKSGSFAKQYTSDIFKNATSFAVDEPNHTLYVVSNSKIYTFSL